MSTRLFYTLNICPAALFIKEMSFIYCSYLIFILQNLNCTVYSTLYAKFTMLFYTWPASWNWMIRKIGKKENYMLLFILPPSYPSFYSTGRNFWPESIELSILRILNIYRMRTRNRIMQKRGDEWLPWY